MSNLEVIQEWLKENPICAVCGTDLNWHLKQKGNRHVYLLETEELLCSHKCLDQYRKAYLTYQIFNKQVLPEEDSQ